MDNDNTMDLGFVWDNIIGLGSSGIFFFNLLFFLFSPQWQILDSSTIGKELRITLWIIKGHEGVILYHFSKDIDYIISVPC